MATSTDFLGVGVGFPFSFSTSGGVRVGLSTTETEGIQHITESITQIIGTALGSRFMRRDFGSMFRGMVFAPNDPQIDLQIDYGIRSAIARWEPRVIVGPIKIERDEKELGRLDITVEFTIIKTNTVANYVFPYYLSAADRKLFMTPGNQSA